jgi:hypothetical protein
MKIAISVPDPVFKAGEHLARQLKLSRSQLYANALSAYLGSRGAAAVTAKLNEIYGSEPASVDGALVAAQLRSVGHEAW